MEDSTKLTLLKSMTDETDEDILSAFLEMAEQAILTRLYPGETDTSTFDMPSKYDHTQVQISAYLINKRGADGESLHIENGTHRSYESGGIPDSMMKDVIPFVKVV